MEADERFEIGLTHPAHSSEQDHRHRETALIVEPVSLCATDTEPLRRLGEGVEAAFESWFRRFHGADPGPYTHRNGGSPRNGLYESKHEANVHTTTITNHLETSPCHNETTRTFRDKRITMSLVLDINGAGRATQGCLIRHPPAVSVTSTRGRDSGPHPEPDHPRKGTSQMTTANHTASSALPSGYCTFAQAAKRLDIGLATAYRLSNAGLFPVPTEGKLRRVRVLDVKAFTGGARLS